MQDIQELIDSIQWFGKSVDHKESICKQLQKVIDPELFVDIVNAGLVYQVNLNEDNHATVVMTLTVVGCPLAPIFTHDVEKAMLGLDFVETANVQYAYEPVWTVDRMSSSAKIFLGVS